MVLDHLFVWHARKSSSVAGPAPDFVSLREPCLRIETCLRKIAILHSREPAGFGDVTTGPEFHRGPDAYDLLLRIACGLESEVPGESEVFGQFKQSWQGYQEQHADSSRALAPLMRRLFEDVKEIRSRHLTGLGAATYGGLVRSLLGRDLNQPTLLIGAGEMARAVLPYLSGRPLWIVNRTPEKAAALVEQSLRRNESTENIHLLGADLDAEIAAWRKATNVLVCVPTNRERDPHRVRAWRERTAREGRLLHLGKLTPGESMWNSLDRFATLVDLFALQTANSERRRIQLHHARDACRERAQLRGLGGAPGVAHGWEDLSLFAHSA